MNNNIGGKIRKLRKDRGWTQGALATLLNVEQCHVSALELGRKATTVDMLSELSEIFNVPKTYWMDETKDANMATGKDTLVLELMKSFLKEGIEIDEKVIDVISNTIDKYYKKL